MGEKRIISVSAFITLLRGGRSPYEVDSKVTEWECHILKKDDGTPFYYLKDLRHRLQAYVGLDILEFQSGTIKDLIPTKSKEMNKVLIHKYMFYRETNYLDHNTMIPFDRNKTLQLLLTEVSNDQNYHNNTAYLHEWMKITARRDVLPTIEEIEAIQTIGFIHHL